VIVRGIHGAMLVQRELFKAIGGSYSMFAALMHMGRLVSSLGSSNEAGQPRFGLGSEPSARVQILQRDKPEPVGELMSSRLAIRECLCAIQAVSKAAPYRGLGRTTGNGARETLGVSKALGHVLVDTGLTKEVERGDEPWMQEALVDGMPRRVAVGSSDADYRPRFKSNESRDSLDGDAGEVAAFDEDNDDWLAAATPVKRPPLRRAPSATGIMEGEGEVADGSGDHTTIVHGNHASPVAKMPFKD